MPNSKNDKLRKIDIRPPIKGGGSLITSASEVAPPALGTIPTPLNLRLIDTVIARSTQAPMAYINVAWNAPPNVTPEYYEVEYGKASEWTGSEFANPIRPKAYTTSAALLVDADTDYKIRVRAVYRNTTSLFTAPIDVHSAEDDVPPPDFDSYSVDFENGNLIVLWDYVGPNPENFKHARIRIYDASHTTLYADGIKDASGRYIWTEADNLAASSGTGVTSVSVDITPISWTNTEGNTVNDTATSVAPDAITGLAYDFSSGDLELSWTNPTNAPYRLVRINIYADATMAVLYRTVETLGELYTWTVNQNFTDTSNNPDPSVYVTVQVVGWLNQASTVVNTTATKALPDAPATVNTSWDSDAGRADETIVISWSAVPYTLNYELTINSEVVDVTGNTYTYSYSQNVADHGSPGDPTLAISVKSRDRLLQVSSSGTVNNATNAAPSNTFFTLDVTPGFSSVGGIVVLTTTVHDLKGVRWVIKDDTTAVIEDRETLDTVAIFLDLESGDYTLEVTLIDMFDQESAAVISSPFTIDALTIEELRQGLVYSDRPGNSAATLDVLKDGSFAPPSFVAYTNTYEPSYNWTLAEWPLLERIRTITLVLEEDTQDPFFYIATSPDAVTWTYFAGPVTSARILTKVANEAAAQAAPVAFDDVGLRIDLSEIVEARFIRLFHKTLSVGGTYSLYEFFPRRLVQTDDLEVEAVKAINIAAGAVTADKITVTTLGAIQTSTGTLTVDVGGHIKSGMTAWNTGTGYYFDNNGGTPRFMIGTGGGTRLYWDGTSLGLEGSNFVLKTAVALPYTQIDASGIQVINNLGQIQFQVNGTTGDITLGRFIARIGIPFGSMGALSYSSGNGAGSTQKIQIYDGGDANPTATNILSYWHNDRNPGTPPTGIRTGPRTEFVGTNGNIGGDVNTLIQAQVTTGTNSASVYLRAIGTASNTLFRVDNDGVIYINRGASQPVRAAITDSNDGWLRLNPIGNYAVGIYTPGFVRADGGFGVESTSGIFTRTGAIETYGGKFSAYQSTGGGSQVEVYAASNIGYVNAVEHGVGWRQLNIQTLGNAALWLGNTTGHVHSAGAIFGEQGLYTEGGNGVYSQSSTNDMRVLMYSGSNSTYGMIAVTNYAWSTYKRMLINATEVGIASVPQANNRLRLTTTGDNNSHYPLMITDTSDTVALMYVRSSTGTSATGYLAATAWTYISDEKVKENIVDLPSQKDRLKLLKPKTFRYKGEDKDSIGFTAQDMQQVFPELVEEITAGDETLLGIKTTDLIPILVKEIIELREEVDELKKKK